MMANIVIEKPKRSDIEKIKYLFKETITTAFIKEGIGHLTEDITNDINEKIHKLMRSFQDDSDVIFLIAKIDDVVVGTISYGPPNNDIRKITNNELNNMGEIGSIYVLPEFQGKGIASKLVKEMLSILDKKQVTAFCLDCGLKNAQQIWLKKFGKPYIIREDYWGKNSHHMIWLCNVSDFKGD